MKYTRKVLFLCSVCFDVNPCCTTCLIACGLCLRQGQGEASQEKEEGRRREGWGRCRRECSCGQQSAQAFPTTRRVRWRGKLIVFKFFCVRAIKFNIFCIPCWYLDDVCHSSHGSEARKKNLYRGAFVSTLVRLAHSANLDRMVFVPLGAVFQRWSSHFCMR